MHDVIIMVARRRVCDYEKKSDKIVRVTGCTSDNQHGLAVQTA